MKIAVITTSYPQNPGDPAGHFVLAEVQRLVDQGHDVTVILPTSAGPGAVTGARAGPQVIPIFAADTFGWPGALSRLRVHPLRVRGLVSFIRGARRALRKHGPWDRVIAHWLIPAGWPIALAAKAPIEIVVHGSDARLLISSPRALREHVLQRLARRDTRFRFVSGELLDELAEVTRIPLRRLSRVEPSPIDVSGTPKREAARARLGLEPEQRVALIASRLTGDKRVETALSAASLLPRLSIVVLGDGPELPRLSQRFPEARFLGRVDRPQALCWIAAADVVLSASRREGAPSVVREARALKTPVVAVPVGDLPHWAENDPELYLVSPR